MSDTTTSLSLATGGDVMNEELLTQGTGVQAKSPRVVIVNDRGNSWDPGTLINQNNTIIDLLGCILIELQRLK